MAGAGNRTATARSSGVRAGSSIRPTGGLPRIAPVSRIVPTNRRAAGKAPLGFRANAIRSYQPRTADGQVGKFVRGVKRITRNIKRSTSKARGLLAASDALRLSMERRQARSIAERMNKGVDGRIAGIYLRTGGGGLNRGAARLIQRRMQRAADAAARGSEAGARARSIYANQLAFMGSGKPKAAKNNLRPGPSNTNGKPKRRRRKG